MPLSDRRARELRIALTVEDYDAAVAFFSAVLGRGLVAEWDQPAGRGGVFAIDRATLELLDGEMAAGVDDLEVGRRVSGPFRIALGVDDVDATVADAEAAGGRVIGPAQPAPWGDRVARVEALGGVQLTLFGVPGED